MHVAAACLHGSAGSVFGSPRDRTL
uniref:Uncharacterized protein n=1 Tax=Anguilla anguilla TaxID=7936 RepID=A0A0E9TE19_ANGAN